MLILQQHLSVSNGNYKMTVTQGRLLPSIVRVNSESDIDEVDNEVIKLPALATGNAEGEQQKDKWWMKEGKGRFFTNKAWRFSLEVEKFQVTNVPVVDAKLLDNSENFSRIC